MHLQAGSKEEVQTTEERHRHPNGKVFIKVLRVLAGRASYILYCKYLNTLMLLFKKCTKILPFLISKENTKFPKEILDLKFYIFFGQEEHLIDMHNVLNYFGSY